MSERKIIKDKLEVSLLINPVREVIYDFNLNSETIDDDKVLIELTIPELDLVRDALQAKIKEVVNKDNYLYVGVLESYVSLLRILDKVLRNYYEKKDKLEEKK